MPSGPPVQFGLVCQHDSDEQTEAERRDGEIMPLEPQDRPAHHKGHRARHDRPGKQAEPGGMPTCTGPMADGIGADTEEAGMAETDLTGKSHQEIEADDRQRENENQRADTVVIGGGEEQRRDNDHDDAERDHR